MFYYLFDYLQREFDLIGAGVFQYISFRAAMAVILSLVISLLFGKRLIKMLHRRQVAETVRTLGLEGEKAKQGTPTMGGLIILAAILIPTLLFARVDNIYICVIIIATVWLGLIGFLDDYIKVFKHDKKGLAGKFKVLGQIGVGIIVGSVLYFHPTVVVKETYSPTELQEAGLNAADFQLDTVAGKVFYSREVKSTETTIPFLKESEFDYASILKWIGDDYRDWAWLIYIPFVILIITAVSNGANLTDGIDGLASGTSGIIGTTLGILAYVSGNLFFADYLNIMYIPHLGELVIFAAAFVGACVGFLWYNSNPAQVFMGDTGSLSLGGIIAVVAIMIRKELLIPILCGIFLVENLSVMIQVAYFKYTKKKYGEGRRIFKMSPLHHHYQKLGYAEPKIVTRFWIVGIMLAIFTIITLKLR
jgi:phospho-N-acetylmuramoyl-pentapeptide-transferase